MAAKKSKTGPCVSLAVWDAFVDGLCHLETTVIADADEAGVSCGTTLWGAENATGQPIQLAWDWREARPGVVAISNPMSIDSNVRLIDALDRPLDLMQRIVQLNNAVFSLPWQRTVMNHVRAVTARELAWA